MLESGSPVEADALILATGGLSVPQTGSDGRGLLLVAQLGHTMHPTYAALTPITAHPAPFSHLAGVSLTVTITAEDGARRATATGGLLCTHRGYSGPAVLDVSHIAVRSGSDAPARLRVRWAGLEDGVWEGVLQPQGARSVARALRDHLPERLALALLGVAGVDPARSAGPTAARRATAVVGAPGTRGVALDGTRRLQEGRGDRGRGEPG